MASVMRNSHMPSLPLELTLAPKSKPSSGAWAISVAVLIRGGVSVKNRGIYIAMSPTRMQVFVTAGSRGRLRRLEGCAQGRRCQAGVLLTGRLALASPHIEARGVADLHPARNRPVGVDDGHAHERAKRDADDGDVRQQAHHEVR